MTTGAAIRSIPNVDLHMHAESAARLDRLRARRDGVPAHDWEQSLRRLADVPAGMARLNHLAGDQGLDHEALARLDDDDDLFVQWLTEALHDAAADGAILVEMRFGATGGLRNDFMALFRKAEGRVRRDFPVFHAEALVTGLWPGREGSRDAFESALRAAREGLAGIDFIPIPYDEEAEWTEARSWASRARDAGLGITAHAGEFGPANIEAALHLPGISRLGHGVHAASDQRLLAKMVESGVTVECCLTSNVVLGAMPSLDDHPIRQMVEAGLPVTLGTDDPVRLCTSIGREYELAASLGLGAGALAGMSAQAIRASFASPARRASLLQGLMQPHPGAGAGSGPLPAWE